MQADFFIWRFGLKEFDLCPDKRNRRRRTNVVGYVTLSERFVPDENVVCNPVHEPAVDDDSRSIPEKLMSKQVN